MAAPRDRIFGIGLNKTGTRSLAVALRSLGFRTLHKGDVATSELVDRAAAERKPLLTHIGDQYDAYLDVDGIVCRFVDLDSQYPGSKFILTTADETAWLKSREDHVLANQKRAERGEYDGAWLDVDVHGWRAERENHHAAVLEHFAGRPGAFLVLDIRGGHGWAELAPFVGCEVPRKDFPWENRKGVGTYRGEAYVRTVRRRADYLIGRVRRGTTRN